MLDPEERYKLTAYWRSSAHPTDLEDALKLEARGRYVARRTPEQRRYLEDFRRAVLGRVEPPSWRRTAVGTARCRIRLAQARQAALSTPPSRARAEQQPEGRRRRSPELWHRRAEARTPPAATPRRHRRHGRTPCARNRGCSRARRSATNAASSRSRSSRRAKARSRDLARACTSSASADAMGTMLGARERRRRRTPPPPSCGNHRHRADRARSVRGLATLHPSLLDELGLDSTVEWYLSTVTPARMVASTNAPAPAQLDQMTTVHVPRAAEAINSGAPAGTRRCGAAASRRHLGTPGASDHAAASHRKDGGAPLITCASAPDLVGGDRVRRRPGGTPPARHRPGAPGP